MRRIQILYIPGLGDHYDGFRRFSLRLWRLFGVRAQLVPVTWYDGKSLDEKLLRIKKAIEQTKEPVVIIGESAGAAVALLAAAQCPEIKKLITICGVTQPTTPVSPYLQQKAPALSEAVQLLSGDTLPSSLPTHSIRSWYDSVVGRKYSSVKAATVHTLWTPGHLLTIVCCLTILAGYVCSLARD